MSTTLPICVLGWLSAAMASTVEASKIEVSTKVMSGGLGIGEQGTVEVLIAVDGQVQDGTLVRDDNIWVEPVGRGQFRTELLRTGNPEPVPARFLTEGGQYDVGLQLPLPPRGTELQWPERILGVAGSEKPLEIPLQWSGQSSLDDIWVAAGAGEVRSVRADGSRLVVGVGVPAAPLPKAIPLLAADLAAPGAPATLGVAILRAKTRLPVKTRPGTLVTVQIGSRVLPAVTADASGTASVTAWVRPGDDSATIRLEDAAGNTNTSTIRLGGDPRPQLVGLSTPGQSGERLPSVIIAAITASGSPWRGPPPECSTPAGKGIPLANVSPGIWRGPVSLSDVDLGTAECHLGAEGYAVVRLRRPAPTPAQVVLRANPPELDASSPEATVRAWVVDRHGDRLPVEPPQLVVEHGTLRASSIPSPEGVAHQRYDGSSAVARGGDEVRATWSLPNGSGPARDLELRWQHSGNQLRTFGRVLDAEGRPLVGVPLVFALGDSTSDGAPFASSWGTAAFPMPNTPQWLSVRGSQSGRSVGTWVVPGTSGEAAPTDADLSATLSLRIIAGPVRRVALQVNPPTLRSLDSEFAQVVLELTDRDGNPVVDVPVELSASRGILGDVEPRPDGRFVATYRPDRAGDIGKVEIVASSPEDHFPSTATELELVAEEVRRAPGLHLGWLAGPDGVSSPWVSIDGDLALSSLSDHLHMRLSAGLYGLRASATDPDTGQQLSVAADLVPIGVGLLSRRPRGRFVTWAGGSLLAVPYRISVSVDATTGLRGLAFAPPGGHAYTGAGLRTRHGEVDLNIGYLIVQTQAGDGGWQGSAGGLLSTIGYRHLF